jgi:soluble lytic murein transglycosylase
MSSKIAAVQRRLQDMWPILVCLCAVWGLSVALPTQAVPTRPAPPSNLPAVDREFIQAKEAFDRRDLSALSAAKDRFANRRDYVLSPYVKFWWLSANVQANSQNAALLQRDIDALIESLPGTPIADGLARDTLRALGRTDNWLAFAALQMKYAGDDIEVACHRIRDRLREPSTAKSAQEDVIAQFAQIRSTPDNCHELFARLRVDRLLSIDDVWKRVRDLLDAGQLAEARRTVALIPNLPASFEPGTASANLDARKFLSKHVINKDDRPSVELALFALTRLAKSGTSPNAGADDAAAWLKANESKFKKSDAQYAWAQVGYLGALQQEADALDWFSRAGTRDLNDTQAAWMVRAALRQTATDASTWAYVERGISKMTEVEQRESAWRYWLARAREVRGGEANVAAARALREGLARENNFYGVLAAEELGVPPVPNFMGYQPPAEDVAAIAARDSVKRAFALYKLDLRNEGLREWQFLVRPMDDKTLLAAAEAARREGLPDRAINTAERTQSLHDFGQRYPLPHREQLQARAKDNQLDEAWVFGLIRQESRFIADAKSRVGAMGLMQLMPATAKWAAKQVGLKDFSQANVTDVPVNLSLGSFYLRHVLDDLGHPVLATAAYNAGPGRARRWRAATPLEGAIYAESIPFNETRDYVKKVMVNKWFYSHRIAGKAPKLSEIMGVVPARGARVAAVSAVAAARAEIAAAAVELTKSAAPAPAN